MSFSNVAVDLASLPRFAEAPLHPLDRRYPPLVLAVALLVELPILLGVSSLVWLLPPLPFAVRLAAQLGVLAVLGGVAWYAHRWALTVRYAVREHDVIVRSGLLWRRETVQPIRRIQHVEQVQGPLDKRFGLSTLKLFSAGTGNVTLRIPGLDLATAEAIGRFILSLHEPASMAERPATVAGANQPAAASGG